MYAPRPLRRPRPDPPFPALIASRIWFTTKKVARFSGQQTLLPVVIVVVESGAIYSISCITLLTVYLLGSNAQYPALDGVRPRAAPRPPRLTPPRRCSPSSASCSTSSSSASRWGQPSSSSRAPPAPLTVPARSIAHGGATEVLTHNPPSGIVDPSRSYNGHAAQYPMKPLAVTVTQLVHKETDPEDATPVKEADAASFTDDSQLTTHLSSKERGSWNAV